MQGSTLIGTLLITSTTAYILGYSKNTKCYKTELSNQKFKLTVCFCCCNNIVIAFLTSLLHHILSPIQIFKKKIWSYHAHLKPHWWSPPFLYSIAFLTSNLCWLLACTKSNLPYYLSTLIPASTFTDPQLNCLVGICFFYCGSLQDHVSLFCNNYPSSTFTFSCLIIWWISVCPFNYKFLEKMYFAYFCGQHYIILS